MAHHTLDYQPTPAQMATWERDLYALMSAVERWRLWVQCDVDDYGHVAPQAPASGIIQTTDAIVMWADLHHPAIDTAPLLRMVGHLQVAAHPARKVHDPEAAPGGTRTVERIPPSKDEIDHVFCDCLRILDRIENAAAVVCGAEESKAGDAAPPMTDTERTVFEIIESHPDGIMGAGIVAEASNRGFPIENSTLTKHIIPRLKQHHGVKNRRGVGYYVARAT